MSNIFLYFPVPVHYGCCKQAESITISFKSHTYVFNTKKFYYILSLINKLEDYLDNVENTKLVTTAKWLHSKGLDNEAFLETVSVYKTENRNIKQLKNYAPFLKNEYYLPRIEEMIKNSLQKAFLFDYLFSAKIKFNKTAEEKISCIKNELENIDDIQKFQTKRDVYKKNIFNILLNNFLSVEKNCLNDYFKIIDNFSFQPVTEFKTDEDFNLCNVTQLKDFSNGKFKLVNTVQKECIKEKTLLKLKMTTKKINYFDFDEILKKSFIFTQNRLDFEKKYINSLICDQKTFFSTEFKKERVLINESNGNIGLKEKSICNRQLSDSFYFPVEAMNFSVGSDEYLLDYAVMLNLQETNIQKIKSLIFPEKNEMEANFVNLFFEENNTLPVPLNYAKIDCL
jgi:hypothetical protein